MELTAIIISISALCLSALTFYWTSIREKIEFYLIRIDRMDSFPTPEFALVNGGSKDILITTIECGFISKKDNGCTYLPQRIEINENDSLLLQAGKSFHCKVKFLEPFTSSFAKQGEISLQADPPIYQREMKVNVAWIESNGNNHYASAIISKYGFSENGEIRMHTPMRLKHDLYK